MFKRMCLVLCLVLALMVGGVAASEEGQQCTINKLSKVMQVMPGNHLKGVITPAEIGVELGPELEEKMVKSFNAMPMNQQFNIDWTGGHLGKVEVDFGRGPVPVMIIVQHGDLKDCK